MTEPTEPRPTGPAEPPPESSDLTAAGEPKEPFVPPIVSTLGSLPDVTGQDFIGTFSP